MQGKSSNLLAAYRVTIFYPDGTNFDLNLMMSDLTTCGLFIRSQSLIDALIRQYSGFAGLDVSFLMLNESKLDSPETNIKVVDLLNGHLSIQKVSQNRDEPDALYHLV